MNKKTSRPTLAPAILTIIGIIGIAILVLNACSSSFEQADTFQRTFNDHAEGWLNLVALLTKLGGWMIAAISWVIASITWLRGKFEFKTPSKDTQGKKPVFTFLTVNGKSLFWQLSWRDAQKSAKEIANRLLDVNSPEFYDPTLIVCIGRGGAIFGSMISYQLGELPILALDRKYNHFENGRLTKTMYPFRIPKAYLKQVLLVAGEAHTRKTLRIFTEKFLEMGAGEIRNCVFYNQQLPEERLDPNVEIHYSGISRKRDYLMPWQTETSLHPSESKEDAEAQNNKIARYVTEAQNRFDAEDSGFYCMRHAETEANAKDVFIGSGSDIPLTSKGKEQARKTGEYFKSIGVTFDTIYYSPMVRCFETAREISSIVGGQMIPDKRLMELDYGDWEGISRSEIENKYAEDYKQYCSDMSCRPTGSSESANDVSERIAEFLQFLKDSNATMGKNVLVVTHKTTGRILLQRAGHCPGGHFRDIPFDNAAIGYVSMRPNKISVILDNKQC